MVDFDAVLALAEASGAETRAWVEGAEALRAEALRARSARASARTREAACGARAKADATSCDRSGLARAAEARRRREEEANFDPRAEVRRNTKVDARGTTVISAQRDDDDGRGVTLDAHERAWLNFERRFESSGSPVTLNDVPWPPSGAWLLRQLEETFRGEESEEAIKRAHKAIARRWHPDKFAQRFGRLLDARERDQIIASVQNVYQSARQLYDACTR